MTRDLLLDDEWVEPVPYSVVIDSISPNSLGKALSDCISIKDDLPRRLKFIGMNVRPCGRSDSLCTCDTCSSGVR